jgi:hypothetical protein
MNPLRIAGAILGLLLAAAPAAATTVDFAGYTWDVREGGGGPGPNQWRADNVRVGADGLHLRISVSAGVWSCAEVTMTRSLGFGTYVFELAGRPDTFDRNVVLGLFDYPPKKIGPDGTNEIDIEFAQWGDPANDLRLNWTVYPPALGPDPTHKERPLALAGNASTHQFEWTTDGVRFASYDGWQDAGGLSLIAKWNDAPSHPRHRIPQQALPVHMNLWLFDGQAPVDGQEVEVVIRNFSFKPL